MSSARPLWIFAKPPVPGHVKTRLAATLGPSGAAELYTRFLEDTLAHAAAAPGLAPRLSIAGDPNHPNLPSTTLPRARQPEGDLGAKMGAVLADAVREAGAGLVVGSDLPTLPAAYLVQAARALDHADLVLGPSVDGGYYLIGARHKVPDVFTSVRWSTPAVLADTLARAARCGARTHLLPPWYDVDTSEDLRLLSLHLTMQPGAAPATARALLGLGQRSRL